MNKGTKKILTALFMLCLLINFISLDVSAEEIQYEPAVLNSDGYYEIDSAEKLFWFAAVVNEGYGDTPQNRSANALVTCEIKVPDGYDWVPIGQYGYSGTFDGGDYQIYNLHTSSDYNYAGMFGKLEDATVKNIQLYNSSFSTDSYGAYAGGIAGMCTHLNYIGTTIDDCSIYNVSVSGHYAGGIAGSVEHYSKIINSSSATGANEITAAWYGGGIAGYCHSGSTLTDCTAGGNVTGRYAGGVVGYVMNDAGPYVSRSNNITICSSVANVGDKTNTDYAGGIVGYVSATTNMTINNCCATGSVTAKYDTSSRAGGLLGGAYGDRDRKVNIKNSFVWNMTMNGFNQAALACGSYVNLENCYTNNESVILNLNCTAKNCARKTNAQFRSGEVAYLLDEPQSSHIWGQNIDNGNMNYGFPSWGFAKVYAGYTDCLAKELSYSNSKLSTEPEHTPGEWTPDEDASTHSLLCALCKTPMETEAHNPETDDGDCLTAVKCSKCPKIVTEAALEHDFSQEVDGTRKDATCMETGSVIMKCSNCDVTHTLTLEIDAENHTGNVTTGVDASTETCGSDGYSGDTVCECGFTVKVGTIIPATGNHTDLDGDKDHKCDSCPAENVTEHKGGTATCMAEAICSECEQPYGQKNPENHTGNITLVGQKDATADEDGYTGDTVCECGTVIEEGEIIPALGNDNDDIQNGSSENNESNVPSTGDTANLTLWFLLMISSFMTIVLSIHRKKA